MRVTKKLKSAYIKHKLSTSNVWAINGLMAIYKRQTPDEQANLATSHDNNMGFTGHDGRFFSALAQQYKNRKFLSPKQTEIVMKKISKYWKQILSISDERKLISCMYKDNWITLDQVQEFEADLFVGKL